MELLYLKRDDLKNNIANKRWRYMLRQFQNRDYLSGQNGFFEGALHSAFKVREISWHILKMMPLKFYMSFDAVVVNRKSSIKEDELTRLLSKLDSVPKIYFGSNARTEVIPSNELLNNFDLFFKREPYKDLDKYTSLSQKNKDKIKPTMLACPLIKVSKDEVKNYLFLNEPVCPQEVCDYDLSFSGKGTSLQRYNLCNHLAELDIFRTYLSIYGPHKAGAKTEMSAKVKNIKFDLKSYRDLIKKTKINLAFEGIGWFTHRHLELWSLGAFILSNNSINYIQLPNGEHVDGVHYESFNNKDDLADKIKFYLNNDSQRKKIAKNGYQFFQSIYNFKQHGQYIRKCIENLR